MATQTKTPRKKAPAAKKPKATQKASPKATADRHTPRGLFALAVAAVVGVVAGLVLLVRRFNHRAAATS